jgi:hypothetical protein
MSTNIDPKIASSLPRFFRSVQYRLANLGSKAPPGAELDVYRLRPWYHDYSALGVRTNFDGIAGGGGKRSSIGSEICWGKV